MEEDAEKRTAEDVLHAARAAVLADLAAQGVADAATAHMPEAVSLLEDALSRRRWWLEQWPDGAEYVPGCSPRTSRTP